MTRAIVAASVHRPAFRIGDLSAEGPDEDTFTLAVAAAERLLSGPVGPGGPLDGIHLVGDFPSEADAGLPEALGAHAVAVERHGSGTSGLGAAFRAASRGETPGSSLVLVAEVARGASAESSATGAAAVAFRLGSGAGLRTTGAGGRRHPPHRVPDADAWVADAVRHSGVPASGASGSLYFLAKESPPVLLAFWRRAYPSMTVVPGSIAPPGLGPAPSLASAMAVLDLARRADLGDWAVLARVTSEESRFLGFQRTGPLERVVDPTPDPAGLGAPPRALPEGVRASVSEGAYVPRPRYVENLPSRWRLLAERCGACGSLTFPTRGRCRACGRSDALAPEPLPTEGTVLAATVVAPGAHPTEFDAMVASAGAYGVVLAEMAPNVRVTLQVADHPAEPLRPGQHVGTALRRLYPMEGEWRYGRKALALPNA